MEKSKFIFIILLFLTMSLSPALATAAAVHEKAAPLETDQDIFSLIIQAANWNIPNGFQMKGFLRTDLNGDGATDAIVLLDSVEGPVCTVSIIMSAQDGYHVSQGDETTPYFSMDTDIFAGLSAGTDYIALYTRSDSGDCFENEYLFSRDGSAFSLSKIVSVQWSSDSLDATQSTIDFSSGQQVTQSGTMQSDGFWATADANYALSEEIRPDSFALSAPPVQEKPIEPPKEQTKSEPSTATHQPDLSKPQSEGIYCNACGQSFSSGDAFRSHSCVYDAQTVQKFVCDVCGKQFDSHDALANHPCSPPGIELFECGICGQSFSSEEALENHLCISYLDDNSVFCDICGGWYAEGEAFRSHLCIP